MPMRNQIGGRNPLWCYPVMLRKDIDIARHRQGSRRNHHPCGAPINRKHPERHDRDGRRVQHQLAQ